MRHALAEEPIDGITDAERKLTDKGIANTQQAARVMKGLGITPNYFYTSPLVRTQQTADIVGKALGITPEARKEVGPGFGIHAVETLTQISVRMTKCCSLGMSQI